MLIDSNVIKWENNEILMSTSNIKLNINDKELNIDVIIDINANICSFCCYWSLIFASLYLLRTVKKKVVNLICEHQVK